MFPLKFRVESLKCFLWNWKLNFSNVSSEIESWISQRFSIEIESLIFQRFLSDLDYTLHGIVHL